MWVYVLYTLADNLLPFQAVQLRLSYPLRGDVSVEDESQRRPYIVSIGVDRERNEDSLQSLLRLELKIEELWKATQLLPLLLGVSVLGLRSCKVAGVELI
jgi:hypothetical protein